MISALMIFVFALGAALSPNSNFVLYGQIVDKDGKPMEGVRIDGEVTYESSVIALPIPFTGREARAPVVVASDAQGKFKMTTRGTAFTIHLVKPSYQPGLPTDDAPYIFLIRRSAIHGSAESPLVYKMLPGNEAFQK
jgi:hypothetical protein